MDKAIVTGNGALRNARNLGEANAIRIDALATMVSAERDGDAVRFKQASEIHVRALRRMGQILLENKRSRRAACERFIAIARAEFVPSARAACAVCGLYPSLTEAHHVVPLAMQFRNGATTADQSHVWLCPTHHAAVHVLINQIERGDDASKSCVSVICDLSDASSPFVESALDIAAQAFTGALA